MSHLLAVSPVRVRRPDRELGCDVRRTVAFRASCSCGWRGTARTTFERARADGRDHKAGMVYHG